MSQRYWVGQSGDWHNNLCWAETLGGIGGAGVPTADDTVIIPANSGTVNILGTALARYIHIGRTIPLPPNAIHPTL